MDRGRRTVTNALLLVVVLGLVTPVGVAGVTSAQKSQAEVVILKHDVPDRLAVGERKMVAAQLENRGDSKVRVDLIFELNGELTVGTPVTIGPGERKTGTFEISVRDLREASEAPINSGVHRWRLIVDETSVSGEIRIVADRTDTVGSEEQIETSRPSDPDAGSGAPRRGFFTNGGGGPAPAFMDSFTLTVGGFALSVFGIIYQMLQG